MSGLVCERRDASVLERWDLQARTYTRRRHEQLEIERPFNEVENQWADRLLTEDMLRSNEVELLRRARKLYPDSRAYLQKVADGSVVQADHIAQIVRLTRMVHALLPLNIVDLLSDIDPPE